MVYSYNGILLGNEKKQTIDVHNYIDKAHIDERKPFIKWVYTIRINLYTFQQQNNYRFF